MTRPVLTLAIVALIGQLAGVCNAAGKETVPAQDQFEPCYLRVNVGPCAHIVELQLVSEDTVETHHLPPSGREQQACLPVACDGNRWSTEEVFLAANTFELGNAAVMEPDRFAAAVEPNRFDVNYGKLYATVDECMAGGRNDAEVVCEQDAATSHGQVFHEDDSDPGVHIQWQNEYDKPLNVECPGRQAFYKVKSEHSNSHEDRRWQWDCTEATDIDMYDCKWGPYMNNWDEVMYMQCSTNRIMTGVDSYHDNGHEDRRWKFRCCSARNYYTRQCSLSGWINQMDGDMDYKVDPPRVFVGAFSYHSNKYEDRRWKILSCEFLRCEDF